MRPSVAGSSDYQLFGLKIRSEIALPELFPVEDLEEPQVIVRRGDLESRDDEEGLRPDSEGLLLHIPRIARFRISGGDEIVVDAEAGAVDRNVRLFLLGSAFGALLHQRGLLPLHANAVEIDGRAVAFMGPSGAGKSTLAAWFHDHGYRVIADDVCVIRFDGEGRPCAAPGLPRLRLWRDALELMGRDSTNYPRSFAGEQMDKFDVAIEEHSTVQSRIPLAALYVLSRGDAFSLSFVQGVDAAHAVFANTYRGGYLHAANGQRAHWQSAVQLVRAVPVFSAVRDWDLAKLDSQCTSLLAHARSAVDADGLKASS